MAVFAVAAIDTPPSDLGWVYPVAGAISPAGVVLVLAICGLIGVAIGATLPVAQ